MGGGGGETVQSGAGTEVKSDFSEDSEVPIAPSILRVESLAVAGSQTRWCWGSVNAPI